VQQRFGRCGGHSHLPMPVRHNDGTPNDNSSSFQRLSRHEFSVPASTFEQCSNALVGALVTESCPCLCAGDGATTTVTTVAATTTAAASSDCPDTNSVCEETTVEQCNNALIGALVTEQCPCLCTSGGDTTSTVTTVTTVTTTMVTTVTTGTCSDVTCASGTEAKGAQTTALVWHFNPSADATIKVGDTVEWTLGDAIHSITSNSNVWDSGNIAAGGTFSRTFDSVGIFPYSCTPHASMTGTITVVASLECNPSTENCQTSCCETTTVCGDASAFTIATGMKVADNTAHMLQTLDGIGSIAACIAQCITRGTDCKRAGYRALNQRCRLYSLPLQSLQSSTRFDTATISAECQ